MIQLTVFWNLKDPWKAFTFPISVALQYTQYMCQMSAFRQQNHIIRETWPNLVSGKSGFHRDFKQNYKWPSSFHLIPIYRKAKLWREQWFYVRWLIMVFNKLFPAKNTVFSGHWSCVSTAFSGSAWLGLTHFFQIVPLQHSWDAFTWLLYHTGCNCDDINFEVTLTHRTTRGYPFLLHPYWQSNRNICTSRLQFAVSFAGCLCSMSDYSSGNSLEPISVFECFLTQPWSVVSAQLAWNLTRGDTKKGTKHQVLPT